MSAVTTRLIAKEIYLTRWLIVLAIAAGGVALVLANFGSLGFNIGALLWLTVIISCGVILPMYGIHQERKDRSLLFALSLPISTVGYVRAKMFAILACFLLVWGALLAGAVVLVLAMPGIPDGLLPFIVMLACFLLANFSCVMCGALLARSEAAISAIVIVTNMGVTIFMIFIGRMPPIRDHLSDAAAVWNEAVFAVLALEAAVTAFALTLPLIVIARRRNFI